MILTYLCNTLRFIPPTLIYWRYNMKKFLIGAAIGGVVAYCGHRKAKKWIRAAGEATANLEKNFSTLDLGEVADNWHKTAGRPDLRVVK